MAARKGNWEYIPAQNVGSEAEQPERWVDYSTPGYPLVSHTDPAAGFADKTAALESLYLPLVGGNIQQLESVVDADKDLYGQFGITAKNAPALVENTFYDRVHNIDKNDFLDTIGQGATMALIGSAAGSLAGSVFGAGAAGASSLGGQAVAAAATEATGWSFAGALESAFTPGNLASSAAKSLVSGAMSDGGVTPGGLATGMIGGTVGRVAGGGILGSVAGGVASTATNALLSPARGAVPAPAGPAPNQPAQPAPSPAPPVNEVPASFGTVLSAYQPKFFAARGVTHA